MFKTEIKKEHFKAILDGTAYAISKDESYRRILTYIQLTVAHDGIMAVALDGYRAGRVHIKQASADEFVCYFKPIPFTNVVDEVPVVLEYDEEKREVYITLQNSRFGEIRYKFNQPTESFPDMESIYNEALAEADRNLACDARYVEKACKSASAHHFDRHAMIEILSPKNPVKPFIIRSEVEDVRDEQLILPIRNTRGD